MKAFILSLLMVVTTSSVASATYHTHPPKVIHRQQQIQPLPPKQIHPHRQHRHHPKQVVRHHRHEGHHGRIIRRHRRCYRTCPPVIAVPPPYYGYGYAPIGGQIFMNQGNVSLGFRF